MILSETAPLIFQWLPKKFGHSVPNNKTYPYLQRLVNWAKKEPQRMIYLVVNGSALEKEQMRGLRSRLSLIRNIEVIDFNTIDLGMTNFIFSILKKDVAFSQLLKYYYDNAEQPNHIACIAQQIPFAVILDLMRLVMLQNIQKIAGGNEAIYMDFDILPGKKNIGEIKTEKEILMADGTQNTLDVVEQLENSIIAINGASQDILQEMILTFSKRLSIFDRMNILSISPSLVYGSMLEVIKHKILLECAEMPQDQYDELIKLYKFNGEVKLTQDNSWKKENLSIEPELPLDFGGANIAENRYSKITVGARAGDNYTFFGKPIIDTENAHLVISHPLK